MEKADLLYNCECTALLYMSHQTLWWVQNITSCYFKKEQGIIICLFANIHLSLYTAELGYRIIITLFLVDFTLCKLATKFPALQICKHTFSLV